MTLDLNPQARLADEVVRLQREADTYRELHDQRGEDLLAQIALRREAESRARRCLLAYRNARERAAAYAEALEDVTDERDALRAALTETMRRYDEVCAELRERVP